MKRVPGWAVFVGLFVVFFALCAVIPVPLVIIDWVPEATLWNKVVQTLLLNGPLWAGLSLMGSVVGTAIYVTTRHIATHLRRH